MVAGQDVAITSPVPGTTTDVVETTMELLPIGPVVFDDSQQRGQQIDFAHADGVQPEAGFRGA